MKHIKKKKHLSFEDRCVIEEFLNYGYSFTKIANHLVKDRTTISRNIKKHRFLRSIWNCNNEPYCYKDKPPYVCNGWKKI